MLTHAERQPPDSTYVEGPSRCRPRPPPRRRLGRRRLGRRRLGRVAVLTWPR